MSVSDRIEGDVEAQMRRADQASREGRAADAVAAYQAVLSLSPENPRALNALGNRALAARDAEGARTLFERALAADPNAAPIWLNLAIARRATGDRIGELAALDQALIADPYFVLALLQKAQWLEHHGRTSDAVRTYRALLACAPSFETLAPAMRQALEHGQKIVAAEDDAMRTAIAAELGDTAIGSQRFRDCVDVLTGRRKVYVQQPAGLHFPYLPAIQFFDRALFPWFAQLEEGTVAMRAELVALTRAGIQGSPYVQVPPGQPANQWNALNGSLDWGALFLWKDGAPVKALTERCPITTKLLSALPLLDIPGRAPTVMFSSLAPRTHIPPHHGVTNLRCVVHLPLIVPEGCRFRVGSETRSWREGEAWAFDDTIEHEAWNDSDEPRVILLIDAWNPLLDDQERELLRRIQKVLQNGDVTGFGA